MRTRRLGTTDLQFSVIGFGSWAIGGGDWRFGWGDQDAGEAIGAIGVGFLIWRFHQGLVTDVRGARIARHLVAGISLPLFAGAQAAPQIAQARAARALVDGERTAAQLRAETRLFELVQELRHANTEAQVLRDEVLPQMRAVVEAAADGWRRGRYSYLEWSEVQREHVEVQRALIEAVEKAQTLRIEIERLSGLPVADPDALEEGTQP